MTADHSRTPGSGFEALAAALQGDDVGEIRCPECDVRYLDEAWPGVWECRRCGRVENPQSAVDSPCPYCGRRSLTLHWEEEIVECASCGVVDKKDVWAIVRG